MFLKKWTATLARAEDDLPHHPLAVSFHGLHDLSSTRMVRAGGSQIVSVERLVRNHGIRPLPEGVHERRRDVARPGPHGEPEAFWHLYPPVAPATASVYNSVRWAVSSPRSPVPILRPSTSTTGVIPPKVPVTNASSAPYTSVREKGRSKTGMSSARQGPGSCAG